MQLSTNYRSETKTVPLGTGTIIIENRSPVLAPKERERRRREVEKQLFDVFVKYTNQ